MSWLIASDVDKLLLSIKDISILDALSGFILLNVLLGLVVVVLLYIPLWGLLSEVVFVWLIVNVS